MAASATALRNLSSLARNASSARRCSVTSILVPTDPFGLAFGVESHASPPPE